MRLLIALLLFLPVFANADSMLGADANVGGGSRPSYGFDFEKTYGRYCFFDCGQEYVDMAFSANKGYGQIYLSQGTQYEHVNFGFAIADTMTENDEHRYGTQVTFGPEVGFMQNITREIYVKENNNYMGAFGRWYLGATLSVGLNF